MSRYSLHFPIRVRARLRASFGRRPYFASPGIAIFIPQA